MRLFIVMDIIQRHVEGRPHLAKHYTPTQECRKAVKEAIKP